MSKIILNNISAPENVSLINDNFQKIATEFDNKVLYRKVPAQEPNMMDNPLDMNGERIYNLPEPIADHEAARLEDIKNHSAGGQYGNTLRTPEPILELPNKAGRAGRVITFDANGNPITVFPASDSSTQLRMDLAASNGSSLIGHQSATVEGLLQKLFSTTDRLSPSLNNNNSTDALATMQRFISAVEEAKILFGGSNGNGQFQGISVETQSRDGDAFYGHKNGGIGYAFHGVSSSPTGSGGGFAADSETGGSSGVVGNRYNGGSGNGVVGNRLSTGEGNGVQGSREGTGAGNGVRGDHSGAGAGSGVIGVRSGTGNGPAVYGLAQGPGGQDAGKFERTGFGAGQAVVAIRNKSNGVPVSIGYLGYYDDVADEAAGVYGAVTGTATKNYAGKFDGPLKSSAGLGVNGAEPQSRLSVTGSRGGNAALQSLLNQLQTIGLISNDTA